MGDLGTDIEIALGVLAAVFFIVVLTIVIYFVKKCCKKGGISDIGVDDVDGTWPGDLGIRHGFVVTERSPRKHTEGEFIWMRSVQIKGSLSDKKPVLDMSRGMFISKTIDQYGGSIEFYGVLLTIPPRALVERRQICLGVFWTCHQQPNLWTTEAMLTPIVCCQPHGLRLQKAAILKLPHCAVNVSSDWTVTVWCSETALTAAPDWRKFSPTRISVLRHHIALSLDHFTLYSASGQGNNTEAKKWIDLVAFAPPLTGKLFPIRVYCLNDYTDDEARDVKKMVKSEEKQKGLEVTSPMPLAFHGDGKNLCVEMDKICEPWVLSDVVNKRQELDFEQIWQGLGPSCKFVLTSADDQTKVQCSIDGFQVNHEDKKQQLVIAEERQVNKDSSVDSDPAYGVFSTKLCDKITKILDPDVITDNNWIALAEYMDIPLLDIHWLTDNYRKSGRSPTLYLLNKWVQRGKTLGEFKTAMTKIERYDVLAELVQ